MDSRLYEQFAAVEEDHWWWYGRRALVFSFLESLPSSTPRPRLLDFGCGTGALLKHLPPTFEGFGIDSSSDAVEQCKKRGLKNVVQSDGGPLPFADGFLDCVLMLDVLEHLDSEAPILMDVSRCLKKNGTLIVTVPAFDWLWTRWDDLNFHKRRYARSELLNVLTAAKCEISFCSYMNFVLFPLAVARLVTEKLRLRNKSTLPAGAQIPPAPVNSLFKRIADGERSYLARRKTLPWGSSLFAVAKRRAMD